MYSDDGIMTSEGERERSIHRWVVVDSSCVHVLSTSPGRPVHVLHAYPISLGPHCTPAAIQRSPNGEPQSWRVSSTCTSGIAAEQTSNEGAILGDLPSPCRFQVIRHQRIDQFTQGAPLQ